jgi:hypothetical protein
MALAKLIDSTLYTSLYGSSIDSEVLHINSYSLAIAILCNDRIFRINTKERRITAVHNRVIYYR